MRERIGEDEDVKEAGVWRQAGSGRHQQEDASGTISGKGCYHNDHGGTCQTQQHSQTGRSCPVERASHIHIVTAQPPTHHV
eukprot:756709-Hanusia_phi.AAC.2